MNAHVESKKQRIGSRQAAGKEPEHQRIAKFVIVALWPGAVDHKAGRQFTRNPKTNPEFYKEGTQLLRRPPKKGKQMRLSGAPAYSCN